MALSVNTNLAALAARGRLAAGDSVLDVTVRRLSSGLRVQGAKDDAAGLAIASRLTSQLRGSEQGVRNARDGLSLLTVAEATLGRIGESLQRARELLVQAANAGYANGDRDALDAELQQSLDEVDRLASHATYNGWSLLDGTGGERLFQIGAGSGDTLALALDFSARRADLGAVATATTVDLRTLNDGSGGYPFAATYTTVAISDLDFSQTASGFVGGSARTSGTVATDYSGAGAASFSVDGQTVTLNADYGSLSGVASAIQAQLGDVSVSQDGSRITLTKTASAASPTSAPSIAALSGANAAVFAAATGSAGSAARTSTAAGFSVDGLRVSITQDHSSGFDSLVADIQAQLDAQNSGAYRVGGSSAGLSIERLAGGDEPVLSRFTGTGATVFARAERSGLTLDEGELAVQVGDGEVRSIVGTFTTAAALSAAVRAQVGGSVTASVSAVTGRLEISAMDTITVSGSAAESGGSLAFTALVNEPEGSLDDVTADDAENARRALLRLDAALAQVNTERGRFGALQSRFEAVIATLAQTAENTAAMRGRIVDADFAAETAALARQRVLQQAGSAIVAQANVQPRLVLSLLR